jgi:hypothetical protein
MERQATRSRLVVLVFAIVLWNCPLNAQSTFEDDFNRPDGDIGNGWSVWGDTASRLVGGEVRTFGTPGVAAGLARPYPVTFPLRFAFAFRTLNNGIDPYNDSGWFIAFNASNAGLGAPAQLKFYQYAGSLGIARETNDGSVDVQPKSSGQIPGWQDFAAAPAHVAGTVNADLSASIMVTYSNGRRASVSFPPTHASAQGTLLLLGNSNGSNGPHIFDNLTIGPPTLTRVATLAQVASGGGWKTAITLVNPSAALTNARVNFFANDGSPLVLPITFPLSGSSATTSSTDVTIDAHASVVVQSESLAPDLLVGWAEIAATGPLSGYSIFRYRAPARGDSEGTVLLETDVLTNLVIPYDNTNGYRTGVALTNILPVPATVRMTVADQTGSPLSSSQIELAPFEHAAFFVTERFSQAADQLGTIQIENPAGGLTGMGLRFSPSGAFTSVPIIR